MLHARTLPTVLVVDDDSHAVAALRAALEEDFAVLAAPDAETATAYMAEHWVQVALVDHRLPGGGAALLSEIGERWPETVRLSVAAASDAAAAMEACEAAGLYQVLIKPCRADQTLMAIRNAARLFELSRDHERMTLEMRCLGPTGTAALQERRRALVEGLGFETIHRSPGSQLNHVIEQARLVASFDVPCLLTGEPGTGKAALARAMHAASLRSDRPFHEIDCTGLDDAALSALLFGTRKGANGAAISRPGLLQKAGRGTVYLAGVDALSPAMQLRLLRLAHGRSFLPEGACEPVMGEARLMTGAHRDLRALMEAGRFRPDLYHELAVTELAVPPLRARRSDVALLAERMLHDLSQAHGKPVRGLSAAALTFLEGYDWPGNLPELRNELTRMLICAQDVLLGPELIGRHILQAAPCHDGAPADVGTLEGGLKERVEMMEMRILRETLTRLQWNKSRAATELGLSRVGLRAKLDRYGIRPVAALEED